MKVIKYTTLLSLGLIVAAYNSDEESIAATEIQRVRSPKRKATVAKTMT